MYAKFKGGSAQPHLVFSKNLSFHLSLNLKLTDFSLARGGPVNLFCLIKMSEFLPQLSASTIAIQTHGEVDGSRIEGAIFNEAEFCTFLGRLPHLNTWLSW